jgi:hypothetical protein
MIIVKQMTDKMSGDSVVNEKCPTARLNYKEMCKIDGDERQGYE